MHRSNSPTGPDAPTGTDTYPLTGSVGCHCRLRPHGALPIFHPLWTHMRAGRVHFMGGRDSALKVLVGVDGSPSSHAAPRRAVPYAERIGCDVWQWLPGSCLGRTGGRARGGSPVRPNDHGAMPRQVHQVLGEAGAAQGPERPVRGNPVEALLGEAEGAVVGSRGMGGFRRTLLSSVSQQSAMQSRGRSHSEGLLFAHVSGEE